MLEGPLLLLLLLFAILFIIAATSILKIHPFLVLIGAAYMVGILSGMPLEELNTTINTGVGNLMRHIGLVIVLGTIIGVILEKSGGALRMAELVIRCVGVRRPQLAMTIIGGIVSVPVFCDSGYVILSSLCKATAQKAKVPRASMSVALATGLYATHTLVPPTPGPIAAAGNIGATDYLGIVILLGFLVSIPTAIVGYIWAIKVATSIAITGENDALTEISTELENDPLPPVRKSLAPVVVPIILIAFGSIISLSGYEGFAANLFCFLGAPATALSVGLLFSLLLLPKFNEETLTGWIGTGITSAGPILLITCAGGAFGSVLSATPIAALIKGMAGDGLLNGPFILILPFAVAACLKSAQGSSTAALVITSALVAPLLAGMGIASPVQLALVVMAIGAGAMTVSHANDSYFWVVTQFSGMTVKDAYKAQTFATFVQGITAFVVTFVLYLILV